MCPSASGFVVKATQSPSWAVDELAERIEAGEKEEARALAIVLVPFWAQAVTTDARAAFTAKLFSVADSLEDESLASRLLAPLAPHLLMSSTTAAFAKLVARYGLVWSQNLFEHWIKNRRSDEPEWIRFLPGICQALLVVGGKNAEAFAPWLVSLQISALDTQRTATNRDLLPMGKREEQKRVAETIALLEAVATVDDTTLQGTLVSILTSPHTAFPVMTTGTLLQKCRESHEPAVIKLFGLGPVFLCAVATLESLLARPVREDNDWSIDSPAGCSFDLCETLSTFLRDASTTTLTWPLADNGRHHIHNRIDNYALPITYQTLRQGRPHKLILTKQPKLFAQAEERRERQTSLLTWLREHRNSFCTS